MKNSKWIKILLISLLGITAFCLVSIVFRIYTFNDLPISFIGACLGATISAILTQLLLTGQTDREEIKERNVKVFEKKSREFEKYIEILINILDKKNIDLDDYEKLMKGFSFHLMLYLSEKTINKFTAYLMIISRFLFINDKSYEDLKKNIVGILNILSYELGLGGNINFEIYLELEKPRYSKLFKDAILSELNKNLLKTTDELIEGKYLSEDELVPDGYWGGEYVCFEFRRFKGCKLLIGSFTKYCPHGGIWLLLFIEKDVHKIDEFRYNDEEGKEERFCEFSKYLIEIWDDVKGENNNWAELTKSRKYNTKYSALGEFDVPSDNWWLFLDDYDAIKNYQYDYENIASIIGKRAAYWFKYGWVWEKKSDSSLSIIKFLEKYLGSK
jgi:hypothetical protein